MKPQEQLPVNSELAVSSVPGAGLSKLPPEADLATVRQMMETLLTVVDTLQQNQAVQFAGVHDRLDAVELELPLIQEQSALRMRALETRLSAEIGEAAKSAAEDATSALQQEVLGKFGTLAAQIEIQQDQLTQMRESRELAESKLNSVILNIERLCANIGPAPAEAYRPVSEASNSQFRTRIAEHIRRAAVDAAPDDSNPLVADGPVRRNSGGTRESASPGLKADTITAAVRVHQANAAQSADVETPEAIARETVLAASPQAPALEDWKRQFMQAGEPVNPTLLSESLYKGKPISCPRCYSERTRPATPARLDGLLRLTGFSPHRCRSCGYRFYRRGVPAEGVPLEESDVRQPEALESR